MLALARIAVEAGICLDSDGVGAHQQPELTSMEQPRSYAAALARWSSQEIRRVATCIHQRRIEPAAVIT
jgi:hypothetical protein